MRRPLFLVAAWVVLAGGLSPSRAGNLDRTATGQDVTVAISSPFTALPPGGCVPYEVKIQNDRNSAGSWHLIFQGRGIAFTLGNTVLEKELSVAAHSSGTFELYVPLPIVPVERGTSSLNVRITGPGFSNSNRSAFAYFYTNSTNARLPYAVIGQDVLGSIGLGPLEALCKDKNREFYGSKVEAARLPSDWRGYAGIASLLLKDTEWLGLTRAQRDAVTDYVAQGGRLIIYVAGNPEMESPHLQLPIPGGKPGPLGFGSITLKTLYAVPPEAPSLFSTIISASAPSALEVDKKFSSWGMRKSAGVIAVNGTLILAFVFLFGVVVSPVNLFVFARGRNRFRLFWTTPLISILASIMLSLGILITDGLGGRGKQMIAFYSLPEGNRQAVIQEQVARTGVLFSNRWRNTQDYLITPVSNTALNGSMVADDRQVYQAFNDDDETLVPDGYQQEGDALSGNWFRSRAVSGQYLQTMQPSRSVLAVLNPAAADTTQEAPLLLSSFPRELAEVYLVDRQGNYWSCRQVEPGQKKACTSSTRADYEKFWRKACEDAGGKLRLLLNDAAARPGCFYATGLPAPGDMLATLPEIRWQPVTGLYLGSWVASPATEAAP